MNDDIARYIVKPQLTLKNFSYQELLSPRGLQRLDEEFLKHLENTQPHLLASLLRYRQAAETFIAVETSELLLQVAPFIEEFITDLFNIESAVAALKIATLAHQPVFAFKQWFVMRQARRNLAKANELPSFKSLQIWLEQTLTVFKIECLDPELAVAQLAKVFLSNLDQYSHEAEMLTNWCTCALTDPEGKAFVKSWVSFHIPQKLDYENLVAVETVEEDKIGRLQGPPSTFRQREGFKLTDQRMNQRQVLNEVDYCVYCHEKDGDFCSKGFPVKKGEPDKGLKTNPLGEILTGCPLEEKISEMHVLKRDGYSIAALAMIMADNPMCPATGHRICNDCMKACIYQKQEPVNIPQTETGILTDVLALPWGVEIYDLLTRWNPLRNTQWLAKPYNGLKVLVMGMGPAGFTLAHHLLMEGFAVVGADGLKIEPLPRSLIHEPIYSYDSIKEALDERVMAGFGGVAEYGITVRWDKNFLKLIYISLMRRPYFQVFGGVRFGGTLKVEDAWDLGFDHLAIAVGAGLPKELAIPGSLAPGMRQANDFLMALQLTGAAKNSSLANLQVRLPAVVIGGGLTGIDTATEVQAYYITQVEKILLRYEQLVSMYGEARIQDHFLELEFSILHEFLTHGRMVRDERNQATAEGRNPDLLKLIRQWGGVTVVYRGLLRDSPAYKRNNEEVSKAFEEGIFYIEGLTPKAVRLDQYGHVEALVSEARIYNEKGEWVTSDEQHVLPARAIFVATGAKPNIAYEFEHRGTFHREGYEYQTYSGENELIPISKEKHSKLPVIGSFTSYQQVGRRVSFLGDTHPVFHGSVVKAIASAKRTYPQIVEILKEKLANCTDEYEYQEFAAKMSQQFLGVVKKIKRHTPSIIEITVQAPLAARNFQPGHFYRLQNYETNSQTVNDTKLQMEALALTGASVDKSQGIITMMVLEHGASSRLVSTLKPGEPISVMGPTGVRTKIPDEPETVMVIGGRLCAAQIRTVGPALRKAGCRVLYVAGFRTAEEVFCQDELEAAADKVIWVVQSGEPINARRPQDRTMVGDFLSAILQYARGDLDGVEGAEIPLATVDRVMVIGTRKLLRMIQESRQTVLKDYFIKNPPVTGSVHGPMQCMLKGVCAQCLTWQIDPVTGKRTKAVFACSWHDQPLEMVDLDNLDERLAQNRTQEILTNLWLDYLFVSHKIERV